MNSMTISSPVSSISRKEIADHIKEASGTKYDLFWQEVDGFLMLLPDDKAIAAAIKANYREPFEYETMLSVIKPGMTVVDAGACVGSYTLQMAKAVGPNGKVIAIEPDVLNYELMQVNCEINGFDNVEMHQVALSDHSHPTVMGSGVDNVGDNVIGATDRGEVKTVWATTLDQIMCGRKIDFMKMDIQGMEVAALHGGKDSLARSPRSDLLVEYCPVCIEACGSTRVEFAELLFSLYSSVGNLAIIAGQFGMLKLSKEQVINMQGHTEDFYVNLWCRK